MAFKEEFPSNPTYKMKQVAIILKLWLPVFSV